MENFLIPLLALTHLKRSYTHQLLAIIRVKRVTKKEDEHVTKAKLWKLLAA